MNDHLPALPDEDTLVIPPHWGRRTHPRRGGVSAPRIRLDESAERTVAESIEAARDDIERVLGAPDTDPALATAARAHLGGDHDPLGAAVVALVANGPPRFIEDFVDGWAFTRGAAFAACALTEVSGLDEVMEIVPGGGSRIRALRPARPGASDIEELADKVYRAHPPLQQGALRVRTLLAAATGEEYAAAVERLAERRVLFRQRVLTAYLVPTRQDWVTELCEDPGEAPHDLLLSSLGSAGQLDLLGDWAELTLPFCYYPENLRALAEGAGPAAAPLVTDALDRMMTFASRRKALLEALGVLPSDEAFRALVERRSNKHVSAELMKAMKRFPVRALRELAAVEATGLLEEHVHGNRELVEAALPSLPEGTRAAVERIIGTSTRVPEASPEELPGLLVEPPWTRTPAKPAQITVKGLTVPDRCAVRWAKGEQDRWAEEWVYYPYHWVHGGSSGGVGRSKARECERSQAWEWRAKHFAEGRLPGEHELPALLIGPHELFQPLVAGWKLRVPHRDNGLTDEPERWGKVLAGRYEMDALPILLPYAKNDPKKCGPLLVPFLTAEVAALMADWLMRLKKAREYAETWLDRHGIDAVPLLVPDALGKRGPGRRAAENALQRLSGKLGRPKVVEAARFHGDEAAQAVETLLAAEPETGAAPKVPQLAGWADPAVLPQILMDGRRRALPDAAVRHALTILGMSTPEEPHDGVAVIRESCDAASLADFGWALFERWREHGEPPGDAWALTVLGWFGDDEAARRLAPIIRAWPGESGHHKAVKGVDVLARIGSEAALAQLDAIARKTKFGGLREYAEWKMDVVADGLGLTGEQLADRLVPALGLDAGGGMTLDYGPRRFRVGFDEALSPYVTDQDGRPRKALPKPGAKDDPVLAPAAHRAFGELKKNVRAVAGDQIRRLERAMVTGRTWTPAEFDELFVRHPLIWHIARRLVWTCDGVPFRPAEDRTFADVGDETLTPSSATAVIALAHPVKLGESLDAWTDVFTDYELAQPFPQLQRPVHELTEEERQATRLARFEDVSVPFGKVLGLTRRGWERGSPEDNGNERWISRFVPGGLYVVVNLDPGIQVGVVDHAPEQRLREIWLGDGPGDHHPGGRGAHPFGDLDPVTASEILTDLTDLTL
jgi:hypothetical protein